MKNSTALTTQNFSDETNDRFTNNPAFVASGYDLSGVGRDFLFPGRRSWATLISPNVIVTTNHFKPRGGVRFFLGNDRSVGFVDLAISGRRLRVPETDILLLELAENAPNNVKVYDFVRTPLSNASFGLSGLAGDEIFMSGIHPTKEGNLLDMTVGTNRIDGFLENATSSLGNQLDYLVAGFDMSRSSNMIPFESRGQVGDSGAPAFVVENDELVLLGFNSEITGSSTLISYLGNEQALIQAFIDEVRINGPNVPEPSVTNFSLFACATLLFFHRRRRARARSQSLVPSCAF